MAHPSASTSWEGSGSRNNSHSHSRSLGSFLDSLLSFLATLLHPAIVFFSAMTRKNRRRHRNNNNNKQQHNNDGASSSSPQHQQRDDPEKVNVNANGQPSSSSSQQQMPAATDMNGHAISTPAASTSAAASGAVVDSAALRKENGGPPPVRETSVLDEQIIAGVAGLNVSNDEDVNQQQQQEQQNGQVTASGSTRALSTAEEDEDPVKAEYRRIHQGFMNEALDMARLALKTNETPVGCVLVYDGRVIAKGMNATNITRNGTRHAELMAICALTSYTKEKDLEKPSKKGGKKSAKSYGKGKAKPEPKWGDVDPKDGHLYPYGQKLHPAPRVSRSIISECTLYVTVEPCVMCASLLRQYGIKKVFFGAVNDKFGGTGGVFNIHMNAGTVSAPQSPSLRPPSNKPARPPLARLPASTNGSISSDKSPAEEQDSGEVVPKGFQDYPVAMPMRIGDGGNVEPGYEVEGGWGRDEAVNLLRQFYVQENGRAPVPRKKEGRAARLAAMMEKDGMSVEGTGLLDQIASESGTLAAEDGTPSTPTNGLDEGNENNQPNGDASSETQEPVTLASTSDAKA